MDFYLKCLAHSTCEQIFVHIEWSIKVSEVVKKVSVSCLELSIYVDFFVSAFYHLTDDHSKFGSTVRYREVKKKRNSKGKKKYKSNLVQCMKERKKKKKEKKTDRQRQTDVPVKIWRNFPSKQVDLRVKKQKPASSPNPRRKHTVSRQS